MDASEYGTAMVVVSNIDRITLLLRKGDVLGTAYEVSTVNSLDMSLDSYVQTVSSSDVVKVDEDLSGVDEGSSATMDYYSQEKLEWRRKQLKSLCDANPNLSQEERDRLFRRC